MSVRPIYLIREVETNDELLELVIKSTDTARNKLNEGLCIKYNETTSLDINFFIQDIMKDLKLVD